jgi:galactokinase
MTQWANPEIIASAPGRVNLIGEHIDFCEGFVIPFAIADRTTVKISRRTDREIHIRSAQRPEHTIVTDIDSLNPGAPGDWERYVLGVLWALEIKSGLNIEIDGAVPLGAGLSSSAALECSVALAVNEIFALGHSLKDLALAAQKAENLYVGMPCGIMDQAVSLLAQAGSALLIDCRDLETTLIPFEISSHGLELLIIDTQVHHALVDGGYANRRAACESAATKLAKKSLRDISISELKQSQDLLTPDEFLRARHGITEIARVLDAVIALKESNFTKLGNLISASHLSLRDGYDVSCPELNLAVDVSLKFGAIGARMIGGGFGGSAIALAPKEKVMEIESEIAKSFAAKGFTAPRFFTSPPSAGAAIHR